LDSISNRYLAEGQWITIGGAPDPKTGARHKGGTPVKVDSHGRIIAGPDHLEDKSLARLSSGGFSSRPVILPKTSSRKLDTPGQCIFWETKKLLGPQKSWDFPNQKNLIGRPGTLFPQAHDAFRMDGL